MKSMKPETKINLLVWCGYMLGFVYACFLDYIPGGWKWICWTVMLAALVIIMLLSDRVLSMVRNYERQGKRNAGAENPDRE